MALALYTIWLLATMWVPSCVRSLLSIAEKGGNIDAGTGVKRRTGRYRSLDLLLVVFSNFAVASSSPFGVTLGPFDHLADLFGFDDSAVGRLKTALADLCPAEVAHEKRLVTGTQAPSR